MEHINSLLHNLSTVIDLVGISVLLIGLGKGILMYIKSEFQQHEEKSGIKLIQVLRCKIGI